MAKIEFQFGLRVALNRIDPRQIRSLDTKTFEDFVVSTNTQVSRSAELPAFRVDVSTDILRAVTGEPGDTSLAKRLTGSDALVLSYASTAGDLPDLCGRLLTAYGESTYKNAFGWIDDLALVKDPTQIASLDELVASQIRSGSLPTSHLALPEAIGWEDLDGFKIGGSPRGHVYDELDLEAYLTAIGDERQLIDVAALRARDVSVRYTRNPESFDRRSTLYQCIVSEQRLDNALYVLIEGRWFAVNEGLTAQVDGFVNALPGTKTLLPQAEVGEAEANYNNRLAESDPGRLLLLDAKIVRPGSAASGIEVCDVLTSDGEFIHVKRKSRSATLSHLFAQGSVSADAFLGDEVFRDRIRAAIDSKADPELKSRWLDLIPNGASTVSGSNYTVTYAVISASKGAGRDWLPFFSKLNLMQHGRRLMSMGIKVQVARIPIG